MIVGPSGCGKTTLLNAIAGFHEITSGRITMDGEVLCSTEKPKSTPGPDRIVVFQNGALFPWKSNLENVIFGPVMQGKLARKEALEKGRAMMADAGLSGVEHNYPGEVSSGMRRRVEIVRALMNDPEGAAARRALPRARLAHQERDARGAARDLLQEQGDDLLHHPRPGGGDLPRPPRRHHDDAAVQAEEGAQRRHPASARLQRAHVQALPRADRGDQRRGARRGAEGLPGRGEGRHAGESSCPALPSGAAPPRS